MKNRPQTLREKQQDLPGDTPCCVLTAPCIIQMKTARLVCENNLKPSSQRLELGPPERFAAGSSQLDGFRASLLVPYPNGIVYLVDEDFAVADFPCVTNLQHCLDHLLHDLILEHQLDFDLG